VGLREKGRGSSSGHSGWETMGLKKLNKTAQNLIEYAIVVSIISAGIFAMSTYVYRSVQGTQKTISEEFSRE
jgi:hypothetical protein